MSSILLLQKSIPTEGIKPNPKKKLVLKCWFEKLWKGEKCRCEEIKIIQKYIRLWYTKINKLEPITYNNDEITYRCINVFMDKNRSKNDSNNKKRENIVVCIINNNIPNEYYRYSLRWYNLKKGIDSYIQKLCEMKDITNIENIVCIHKAGRRNHYDFKIIINNSKEFDVEFKFNASCVDDTPQFVSPMKPSQYLDSSYEEYYYENYLTTLVNTYNLSLPTKEEYLKYIHSSKPACVKELQEKYYRGCIKSKKYSNKEEDIDFYESSKKASKSSILDFISKYGLKQDKLTEYLLKTQKNKYYMLYKDGHFYLETINLDDYIITEITKDPEKNRYIAKTKSGGHLKILLRWKNGNGIAFPSFQIS
tara:strand:+ start:173 stop:1264 length:1092 start_codon:yes stop_codon:yes gene_type:complete